MATIATSVGKIDTGSFEPTEEVLDMMDVSEIELIRHELEKEAINIEYQIERATPKQKEEGWHHRASYAMKMRRSNIAMLDRYMRRRRESVRIIKGEEFARQFVRAAQDILSEADFMAIRDAAARKAQVIGEFIE